MSEVPPRLHESRRREAALMRAILETAIVWLLSHLVVIAGIAITIDQELRHPGQEWDSYPSGGWTCRYDCPCKKRKI